MKNKVEILQSLKDAPKSTAALHREFPDFLDRAQISTFLGNLYRAGLIKKQSNGYWKLLDKGEVALRELSTRGPDPYEEMQKATEAAEPKAEPAAEKPKKPSAQVPDVPRLFSGASNATTTPAWETPKPRPTPESQDGTAWKMMQQLQAVLGDKESLVIEQGATFFVLAGRRFEIKEQADLEAALHVAGLYVGVAA